MSDCEHEMKEEKYICNIYERTGLTRIDKEKQLCEYDMIKENFLCHLYESVGLNPTDEEKQLCHRVFSDEFINKINKSRQEELGIHAEIIGMEFQFIDWEEILQAEDVTELDLFRAWGKDYKDIKIIEAHRINFGPRATDSYVLSCNKIRVTLSNGYEKMNVLLEPTVYMPFEVEWDWIFRDDEDDFRLTVEGDKVNSNWTECYLLKTALNFYEFDTSINTITLKSEVRDIITEEIERYILNFLRINNYQIANFQGEPVEFFPGENT